MSRSPSLVRIRIRGLEIDVECREGGIVHLRVRAHQQHSGIFWRLLERLAHTFWRAQPGSDADHKERCVGEVAIHMIGQDLDHLLSHGAELDVFERLAMTYVADGDANDQTFCINEGIENSELRPSAFEQPLDGAWHECADDSHACFSPLFGRLVVVWPDHNQ